MKTSLGADAFVRKYDASGNELWTRQFGTTAQDGAFGAAADSTGVYVAGEAGSLSAPDPLFASAGTFVRKYDHAGRLLWTKQVTERGSYGSAGGVAVDASGVYELWTHPAFTSLVR